MARSSETNMLLQKGGQGGEDGAAFTVLAPLARPYSLPPGPQVMGEPPKPAQTDAGRLMLVGRAPGRWGESGWGTSCRARNTGLEADVSGFRAQSNHFLPWQLHISVALTMT